MAWEVCSSFTVGLWDLTGLPASCFTVDLWDLTGLIASCFTVGLWALAGLNGSFFTFFGGIKEFSALGEFKADFGVLFAADFPPTIEPRTSFINVPSL